LHNASWIGAGSGDIGQRALPRRSKWLTVSNHELGRTPGKDPDGYRAAFTA
jgi:hypothetical protein